MCHEKFGHAQCDSVVEYYNHDGTAERHNLRHPHGGRRRLEEGRKMATKGKENGSRLFMLMYFCVIDTFVCL